MLLVGRCLRCVWPPRECNQCARKNNHWLFSLGCIQRHNVSITRSSWPFPRRPPSPCWRFCQLGLVGCRLWRFRPGTADQTGPEAGLRPLYTASCRQERVGPVTLAVYAAEDCEQAQMLGEVEQIPVYEYRPQRRFGSTLTTAVGICWRCIHMKHRDQFNDDFILVWFDEQLKEAGYSEEIIHAVAVFR